MKRLRNILGAFRFIHLMVFLGLAAVFGYLMTDSKLLIFLAVLSYSGAFCGGYIRIIDNIQQRNHKK